MAIRLTTLGGLHARRDDTELDWLLSQRLRSALFVYLAVERRVSRESLTAVFWPESDEENARHALRQSLYHLRKALGAGWLESRAHELRVSAEVRTDAEAFSAALERGDAEAAAKLYDGPFLEGVNLVDLSAWEGWVDGRRTQYARAFRKASRDWLEARRAEGDLAGAIEAAQRWVAPDPLDDEAQHKLIEALVHAGERAEAIRQYETYARLLEPDGLRPLDETIELIERARAEAASWPVAANGARDSAASATPGRRDERAEGAEVGGTAEAGAAPAQPRVQSDPVGREAPARAWRHRRAWAGLSAVAAIAMVALGAILFAPMLRSNSLDPERVIVYPLVATDPELNLSGAGWDVAVAIGAALEHTEPLRWIDGWSWLPEQQRANPARLSLRQARDIARARGARYYVHGVYRAAGGRPAVTLRLYDAAGDSLVTQQTASRGSRDISLAALGLQSAVGVLQKLMAPDRTVDLAPLAERDPAAIALWIQGEHEYRRAQFEPALDRFLRALAQDSLLVFAAIKGALAGIWLDRGPDHAGMLSLALRHDTLLPPKYRLFARGLRAWDEGRADDAAARFNEVLALAPDWSEAWMALGEVHFHLLPGTLMEPAGPGDSVAVDAFRRAAAIDTSFSPPLVHLAEHAARAGDTDELALIIERLERRGAPGQVTGRLSLLLECHRRGAEAFVRASRDLNRLGAAAATLVAAPRINCAEAGFRRILDADDAPSEFRFGALLGLNGLLLARGRYAEAKRLLDSELDGDLSVNFLYVFDALTGAPFRTEAEAAVRRYQSIYGDAYRGARPDLLWLLGVWHARAGDAELAQLLAEALDRSAIEEDDASLSTLAAAVRAHAILGDGDTTRAVLLLGQLASAGVQTEVAWFGGPPLGLERLVLAELLLMRRRYTEAYDVANAFDHHAPIMFLPLLRRSLEVRARAAEALGQSRVAAAHRARLEVLGSAGREVPVIVGQP